MPLMPESTQPRDIADYWGYLKSKEQNVENEKKNKRQVYIWDDNLAFWESLKNKSRLFNLLLRKYREENGE